MNLIAVILVLLNGQAISFPGAQPMKESGVVLVPARGVFQAMGARVDYNPVTRDVVAQKGDTKIEMGIGRMHAWVNGSRVELPLPVRLQNGHVLIPARFVAEAFDAKVRWDSAKNRVLISFNAETSAANKPSTPVTAAPIQVMLKTDKQDYRVGEAVKLTVVARNTSDKNQILNFNSGQSFDISIAPTNEDESIWRWDWSYGRMFTQALREQTLKPGETISFTATWNQTDNSGQPMPRGEYSVAGKIAANDGIEAPLILIRLSD